MLLINASAYRPIGRYRRSKHRKLMTHLKLIIVKKLHSLKHLLRTTVDERLVIKMSWSIVSKAAERSNRQRHDTFSDPIALTRWSWMYTRSWGTARRVGTVETVLNVAQILVELHLISPALGEWPQGHQRSLEMARIDRPYDTSY